MGPLTRSAHDAESAIHVTEQATQRACPHRVGRGCFHRGNVCRPSRIPDQSQLAFKQRDGFRVVLGAGDGVTGDACKIWSHGELVTRNQTLYEVADPHTDEK